MFERVVRAVGSKQRGYDMFGHSAGGQLLHRLTLFYPESRARRILASNSGFYTLPDLNEALPFGIQSTRLTEQSLRQSFRKNLVLFLGELDNENETRGISLHTPKADLCWMGACASQATGCALLHG